MRPLFNYDGFEYNIKNIVGCFDRDKHSKEIIFRTSHIDASPRKHSKTVRHKFTSVDNFGRKVNSKGYLVDERGNIIDKDGNIIWRSHELMYNEPPKLFCFSEFSLNWIKGHLDRDVTINPRHDDEYDLDNKPINAMGYRVDHLDNIVDVFRGNIVFPKDVLSELYGQECVIPEIFTNEMLRPP